MARFKVHIRARIDDEIEVEAATEDEAIKIAHRLLTDADDFEARVEEMVDGPEPDGQRYLGEGRWGATSK